MQEGKHKAHTLSLLVTFFVLRAFPLYTTRCGDTHIIFIFKNSREKTTPTRRTKTHTHGRRWQITNINGRGAKEFRVFTTVPFPDVSHTFSILPDLKKGENKPSSPFFFFLFPPLNLHPCALFNLDIFVATSTALGWRRTHIHLKLRRTF